MAGLPLVFQKVAFVFLRLLLPFCAIREEIRLLFFASGFLRYLCFSFFRSFAVPRASFTFVDALRLRAQGFLRYLCFLSFHPFAVIFSFFSLFSKKTIFINIFKVFLMLFGALAADFPKSCDCLLTHA